MTESVDFHTDLYRREALESAVRKYQGRARIALADAGTHVVARLEPLVGDVDTQALWDEFCTEAFSATVRGMRSVADSSARAERAAADSDAPPWEILSPYVSGADVGLGWILESLGPIRSGAASMVLRHGDHGLARVAIRRNSGAPLGVAHTDHLDFMLMNGGSGTAQTEGSIGRVLRHLAGILCDHNAAPSQDILAAFQPHAELGAPQTATPSSRTVRTAGASRRIAPSVDVDERTICFELDETGVSRLAIYDAVLAFADRCYVALTRPAANRIGVQLKAKGEASTDELRTLTRDVVRAVNQLTRNAIDADAQVDGSSDGLPRLRRQAVDIEALLAELDAADYATLGVGYQPERGPGHENLRILNILGTGACNSDCLFCCEKFNPTNRLMPSADATRQLILKSSGEFDMLFFASGEPTIHPKLFEYVELAKREGFTCFGMSSHFRTFADPRFALKTLQAGFEYFDISLHAADATSQLDVNPIDDGGQSLFDALKGLANIYRLAEALGIRISVTQKIVVSRLNVTQLEPIFRATYDRGVRNFILQPVRALGLAPERQAALAISEDEILPYLNDFLAKTEHLGAAIKPYGFSRQTLFAGSHIEHEQNRVKNVMGKVKQPRGSLHLPAVTEERPSDGRFWVEIRTPFDERFAFAADGQAPVLDEALQRGARLPFGCRMGSCGMCCAKIVDGTVDQSSQIFLSDEQQQQGFVLLCQARPRSDAVLTICTDDEIDQL